MKTSYRFRLKSDGDRFWNSLSGTGLSADRKPLFTAEADLEIVVHAAQDDDRIPAIPDGVRVEVYSS